MPCLFGPVGFTGGSLDQLIHSVCSRSGSPECLDWYALLHPDQGEIITWWSLVTDHQISWSVIIWQITTEIMIVWSSNITKSWWSRVFMLNDVLMINNDMLLKWPQIMVRSSYILVTISWHLTWSLMTWPDLSYALTPSHNISWSLCVDLVYTLTFHDIILLMWCHKMSCLPEYIQWWQFMTEFHDWFIKRLRWSSFWIITLWYLMIIHDPS